MLKSKYPYNITLAMICSIANVVVDVRFRFKFQSGLMGSLRG